MGLQVVFFMLLGCGRGFLLWLTISASLGAERNPRCFGGGEGVYFCGSRSRSEALSSRFKGFRF